MSDGINSLDQFGPGLVLELPRLQRERRYDDWYDGKFTSLLPGPNVHTGRKLLSAETDLLKVPVFSMTDHIFQDGTIAERPVWGDTSPALTAWLVENQDRVYKALEKSILYRLRKGYGIIAVESDGLIQAVDPSSYIRVGSFERPDDMVAHIVFYIWYEPGESESALNPQELLAREPNRIRVVKYAPAMAGFPATGTTQTFRYSPSIIGEPLTDLEDAGITYLCVYGDGYTYYPDIADVAGRLMLQATNTDALLNDTLNAVRILPMGGLPPSRPGQTVTVEQQIRQLREDVRPVWLAGANPGGVDGMYLTPAGDYGANESFINLLLHWVSLITGASLTLSGVDIPGQASGVLMEKAQARAVALARRIREAFIRCLPSIVQAAGAPAGAMTVSWLGLPFETRDEIMARLERWLAMGAITMQYFQAALGLEVQETQATGDNDSPAGGGGNDAT